MENWKLTAIVMLVAVFIIAGFMEFYKKKIRKDEAGAGKVTIIAGLLSVYLGAVGYLSFELPGTIWSIAIYSSLIFVLQLLLDMKFFKALMRWYMKKKGITLEGYKFDE